MSKSRMIARLLLLVAFPLAGQARDAAALFAAALADPDPDRSVEYKEAGGQELFLHVFDPAPEAEPRRAAILWLHGGGWESGDASQLFPHAAYFASLGYLCLSADYRLAASGNTIFDGVEDSRDAFYWLHAHAGDLGIDPERIIVAGESAGGHLAACVGYIDDPRTTGIPEPVPRPAATLLVNGVFDLTAISWAMTKPGLSPEAVEAGRSISPLFHLDAADPPALLLHGSADSVVPPQQSADFAASLQALGVPANLRFREGKNHAFFLYLPEFNLVDLEVIQLSLLEMEAFLQSLQLNAYPVVDGHFSPVHLFSGPDGFRSFSELIPAGGILFGSTYRGGISDCGVLFSLDPATRAYSVLHAFDGSDGLEVFNGLAVDGDRLYGVAKLGGEHDGGTLFRMNTDGSDFRVLHHFVADDPSGWHPHAVPVLVDGVLYGTTFHGGPAVYGGAVYRYPLPDGPYEVMHGFSPGDGRHPTGQLTPAGDWLYGTASDFYEDSGGHYGSLFRIHRQEGTFELLHSFTGAEGGGHPYDRLLSGGEDLLYGTTFGEPGIPTSEGCVFVYSISGDTLTVLHDFASSPGTGSKPNGSLLRIGENGPLYGLCHGSNEPGGEAGTLFRMQADGSDFCVLHRFDSGLSGNTPMRSLAWLDGAFYGVTAFGGLVPGAEDPESGPGMIFRYRPVASPSPARQAFVRWLAGHGLVVNSPTGADPDRDRLGLLEEFTLGGDPGIPESGAGRLACDSTGFSLQYDRFRDVMEDGLVPRMARDLQSWEADSTASRLTEPIPGDPGFSRLEFSWPPALFQEDPFFVQLRLFLP